MYSEVIQVPSLLIEGLGGIIPTFKGKSLENYLIEVGVPEDPVTGSAHCVLALFWRDRLGGTKFRAYQCSKRGGEVNLELLEDRVLLRGNAVTIFKGKLLEKL